MRPTYKQQYDKIIDAYFKDEIKPMQSQFCFCGTLAPNRNWRGQWSGLAYPYTPSQYNRLEDALFEPMIDVLSLSLHDPEIKNTSKYEDDLFLGMCNALEVLRQIHIEGGEVIEDQPTFTKRQLQAI